MASLRSLTDEITALIGTVIRHADILARIMQPGQPGRDFGFYAALGLEQFDM